MAIVTGGELIVRTLLKAGVTQTFGLYGGHLETVFQALREHELPFLDCRHEVSGGHAAEGYARATGKLGVSISTAGPGFTNVLTSVASANTDNTPVLYISGSAPMAHAAANGVQAGIDQVAMVSPITKWAHRVTSARDIPRLVAHAIRLATSAPTGPVLLEFPIEVSFDRVEADEATIPDTIILDTAAGPRAGEIARALKLLAAAERPVILAGDGVLHSNAAAELRAFAEASGVPVFENYDAHGSLPSSHPLNAGGLANLPYAIAAGQAPDVALAVGLRFGSFTWGGFGLVPKGAKLIQVDADPAEIGRLRDVDIAILADPREALAALNQGVQTQRWPELGGWRTQIDRANAPRRERLAGMKARSGPVIHPFQAAAGVVDVFGAEAIYIGDGAEAHGWLGQAVAQERPREYLTHGHFATLGFGLALSMGAQIANPGRQIVCVTGDGAVGFAIAEFDTMARHRLPIVVVVMNNRSWGATKRFQDMLSGPGKNIAVDLGDARYDLVVQGFGCHGEYVTAIEALAPALERARASGKPALVNVEIDLADDLHPPGIFPVGF